MFYTVSSQTNTHTRLVKPCSIQAPHRHTKQYQHTSWINDILVVLARLKVGQGGVAGCREGHHLQKSNSSSTFYHRLPSATGLPHFWSQAGRNHQRLGHPVGSHKVAFTQTDALIWIASSQTACLFVSVHADLDAWAGKHFGINKHRLTGPAIQAKKRATWEPNLMYLWKKGAHWHNVPAVHWHHVPAVHWHHVPAVHWHHVHGAHWCTCSTLTWCTCSTLTPCTCSTLAQCTCSTLTPCTWHHLQYTGTMYLQYTDTMYLECTDMIHLGYTDTMYLQYTHTLTPCTRCTITWSLWKSAYLVSSVNESLVVELFEDPPDWLHVPGIHRLVVIVKVYPTTQTGDDLLLTDSSVSVLFKTKYISKHINTYP